MSDTPTVRAISEPRHVCLACGRSCHGVNIRLVGEEEVARIEEAGEKLGVENPVEDGRLRRVDGHCVFLSDNALCRIHGELGSEVKPKLCNQYPVIILDTGKELRMGLDPGCYTAWGTWKTAERITSAELANNRVQLSEEQEKYEGMFLARALEENVTLKDLFSMVCPEPGGPDGIPRGFATRWMTLLKRAPVAELIAKEDTGSPAQAALAPVLEMLKTLDPENPPVFQLSPEADAWAVEVIRRMVYLRLAESIPTVQIVVLLMLCGTITCAWADPKFAVFGPAMSAWTRVIRAPVFWTSLIEGPPELVWLATGKDIQTLKSN